MELQTLRAEATRIARLAGPLVVAQLSQAGMGFTDTVMAGRLGVVDLGAVAIGSTLWLPIYLGCVGVMVAVSPSVAHLRGAGRPEAVGPLYRQSLWLSLALALLAFLATRHVSAFMYWLGIDPAIVPVTEGYLAAISWGIPGACFYLGLRFVSEGSGHTRPIMYIQLLALLLNIPGNWVFMYGAFGVPAMGAVGAGWSSAMVLTLTAVAIVAYVAQRPRFRLYRLFRRLDPPRWETLKGLLRLGLPIALVMVMEVGLFTAVALLMGSLGAVAVAAHQIAFNYAALVFMVPLGISMATTVRVGHAAGAGDRVGARLAGFVGMGMAVTAMLVSAVVMLSVPDLIVSMYTSEAEVARLAVSLLFMAALFQVSDGLQASAVGALRGLKETAYPMWVTFFAYWLVGLPLAWTLGIAQSLGPRGLWVGLIAGLTIGAVLLSARFHHITRQPAARRGTGAGEAS
jgi:MATE family multidrug resistance protein